MSLLPFFNKRFYLYLLKELLSLFILSLGVFTFILVLSRIGKIADLVINKGVDVKDIVLLIIYSSPPYLTFTLPMAFLLSTIVVLGRLSSENEILALKANGINLRCLFAPIALLGAAVFFISLFNTTLLLSKSGDAFRSTLLNIAKKGISIEDKEGIFNDSIPGVVIYIDKVNTETRTLSGIVISDDRDEAVRQTITAQSGAVNLDVSSLDIAFLLKNGSVHRWERQNDAYRSLSFTNYIFSMNLMNVLPHNRELRRKAYEMSTGELREALSKAKGPNRYDLAVEFYKKFSIPFASIAFILLAVPLGIRHKTEGKFSGVVYSLVIFISYYVMVALTENVGRVYMLSPFLITFTPDILFSLAGIYAVKRLNHEEQARMPNLWQYISGLQIAKTK
jgi:lipopolysaccharide export system permease protein